MKNVIEYPSYISKICNKLELKVPGVYRVTISTEHESQHVSTVRDITVSIYKIMHHDKDDTPYFRYLYLASSLQESLTRKERTLNELSALFKRVFSGKMFNVDPTEIKAIHINKVTNTIENYFNVIKKKEDEYFSMVNIASNVRDGIYEFYTNNRNIKPRKVYMVKRDGCYLLYGHRDDLPFEEFTPKQLINLVTLMFGSSYGMRML